MYETFKFLATLSLAVAIVAFAPTAQATGFVKYDSIPGEAMGPDGSMDWFVFESFSFGATREKGRPRGGTEDINIGVGELQECTISKSMDSSSPKLAQYAINGNSLGACEICLAEDVPAGATPVCYAHYVMERCFVQRLAVTMDDTSTSGDADDRPTEEVAIYYNKIAYAFITPDNHMSWDNVKNRPWDEGLDWLFEFGGGRD